MRVELNDRRQLSIRHHQLLPDGNVEKQRRPFNAAQKAALEKLYAVAKFPTPDERRRLSLRLGIPKKRVEQWFINQRRRHPHPTDMEPEPEPKPCPSDQNNPLLLLAIVCGAALQKEKDREKRNKRKRKSHIRPLTNTETNRKTKRCGKRKPLMPDI